MATTTDTPRAAERRDTLRRQPAQGTVCELRTDAGEELALGLVWNISPGGVSMLLPKRIEPGTEVATSLLAADGQTSVRRNVRVAHIAKLRTGDYILGAQFRQVLSPDELRPFLAGAAGPSAG